MTVEDEADEADDARRVLASSLIVNLFSGDYFINRNFVYPWIGEIKRALENARTRIPHSHRTQDDSGAQSDSDIPSPTPASTFQTDLCGCLYVAVFLPFDVQIETSFIRLFSPRYRCRSPTYNTTSTTITLPRKGGAGVNGAPGGEDEDEGRVKRAENETKWMDASDERERPTTTSSPPLSTIPSVAEVHSFYYDSLKNIHEELTVPFDVMGRPSLALVAMLVRHAQQQQQQQQQLRRSKACGDLPSVRKYIAFSFLTEMIKIFTTAARQKYVEHCEKMQFDCKLFRNMVDEKVLEEVECSLRRFKSAFKPIMSEKCYAFFHRLSVLPRDECTDGPSVVRFLEKAFDSSREEDWILSGSV